MPGTIILVAGVARLLIGVNEHKSSVMLTWLINGAIYHYWYGPIWVRNGPIRYTGWKVLYAPHE